MITGNFPESGQHPLQKHVLLYLDFASDLVVLVQLKIKAVLQAVLEAVLAVGVRGDSGRLA